MNLLTVLIIIAFWLSTFAIGYACGWKDCAEEKKKKSLIPYMIGMMARRGVVTEKDGLKLIK